ncbi:MAG: phosphoribosylanthranilate isomerase [Terrimicrobiaceae bacterium]|nr:phosphoribosylanthranilate isomerase [Terrimicrobiaceae bacterium]
MNFFEPGVNRIKICGITSEDDARMCIAAGADALGFNFYRGSKRYVDPDSAIPWIQDLGNGVDRVAVVVNPSEELLDKIRAGGCFSAVQFHGDETPAFCDWAGFSRWVKAVRVKSANSLGQALEYDTPNILFDAWVEGNYGGTGMRLNWDMVRDFVVEHKGPRYILAGGLNVHNVRQAIRIVRPHGVDVAGGVEISPGKKEEYLVQEFIRAARG